jgi:hypothetical protein
MFQYSFSPNAEVLSSGNSRNYYPRQYNMALNKFHSMLQKGRISRLKRRILHRPERLYDLETLKQKLSVHGSSYAGIQIVSISSIIGSEGRTTDFDIDFAPLSEAGRERWVNMAMAYLSHIPLPPIQLIQVGEAYFVRDGHHRISVSRAFGQSAMDAEVIAWKVRAPFPWQPRTAQDAACCLTAADLTA